jgi:hypothetical protein
MNVCRVHVPHNQQLRRTVIRSRFKRQDAALGGNQ